MKKSYSKNLLILASLFYALSISHTLLAQDQFDLSAQNIDQAELAPIPLSFLYLPQYLTSTDESGTSLPEILPGKKSLQLRQNIFKRYKNFFAQEAKRNIAQSSAQRLTPQEIKKHINIKEKELEEKFRQWYLAHFFFDRQEIFAGYLQQSTRVESEDNEFLPPELYNKDGQNPFVGYLTALDYLKPFSINDIDLTTIQEIHRRITSKEFLPNCEGSPAQNTEDMLDEDIGVLRLYNTAEVLPHLELTSWQKKRIYHDEIFSKSPKNYQELLKINPLLDLTSKEVRAQPANENPEQKIKIRLIRKEHRIWYAPLSIFEKFQDDLSPPTLKKLKSLKAKGIFLDGESKQLNSLRSLVVRELLTKALNQLHTVLRLPNQTEQKIIEAVGSFYYRFLSIHPFTNGNGRVARLLMQKIFEERGIFPPVFTHWYEDIFLAESDFLHLLKDSVRLSQDFHHHLAELADKKIDYRSLATPYLTPEVYRQIPAEDISWIHPEEFMTWIRFHKTPESEVKNLGIVQALKQFIDWRKSLTYIVKDPLDEEIYHPKKLGIRLATPSFIASFHNDEWDFNPQLRKLKTEQFYDEYSEKDLIFRGFSGFSDDMLPDADLLSYFCHLQPELGGMSLEDKKQHELASYFEIFNKRLVGSEDALSTLSERHRLHSTGTDENYLTSELCSMTAHPNIARNFALGHTNASNTERTQEIVVKTKKRNYASISGIEKTSTYNSDLYNSYPSEKEFLLSVHTDPASVMEVEVTDKTDYEFDSDAEYDTRYAKKFKLAERNAEDSSLIHIWEVPDTFEKPYLIRQRDYQIQRKFPQLRKRGKETTWNLHQKGMQKYMTDLENPQIPQTLKKYMIIDILQNASEDEVVPFISNLQDKSLEREDKDYLFLRAFINDFIYYELQRLFSLQEQERNKADLLMIKRYKRYYNLIVENDSPT